MRQVLKVEQDINCSTASCNQCANGRPVAKDYKGHIFGCGRGKELCNEFRCIHHTGLFVCRGCSRGIKR